MRTRSKARPTCTRGPASAHAAANVEIMEINFPTILNERGLVDDTHYSKGALMELRRHPDTGECLITIYRADDGIEVRGEWPDWRHWRAVAEQRGNALQEIIDARPAGDVYPGDGWSGAHEKFAAYARAALGRDHQQSPRDNKTTELSTAITTIARQQQEIDHLARHFNALIAEHRTAAATLRAAHYSAAADEMEQHCAMYELVANNPSVTPEPR